MSFNRDLRDLLRATKKLSYSPHEAIDREIRNLVSRMKAPAWPADAPRPVDSSEKLRTASEGTLGRHPAG